MTHPIPKPSNHTKEAGMNTQEKLAALAAEMRAFVDGDALVELDNVEQWANTLTTILSEHGEIAVTTDASGRCVAVTRQDGEGRILSVIWEASEHGGGGEDWTQEASAIGKILRRFSADMSLHERASLTIAVQVLSGVRPAPTSINGGGGEAEPERVAQLIAHRACHSAEHDPENGKLHGYCIVCGVPWPCAYAGTPPTPSAPDLDAMVNRFLCWKLPDDFAPDAGISFTPSPIQSPGNLHWPVGTNLLTDPQARAMFEHCVAGAPSAPAPFDVEAMLVACVPGGSICDPQVVADAIREYVASRPSAPVGVEWRWVDEKGRAMTEWNASTPPPMTAVSDERGTMRVETRAAPTQEKA